MNAPQRAARHEELVAQIDWARALARRLARDAEQADELAQTAFAAALERPPASARERGGLRAWLAQVMRNARRQSARAEARRRPRERASARDEALPSTDDVVARGDLARRLASAVMELDEPYRSTVLRRYLDGERSARIAAREGVSPAAVRQRLARALAMLRARLDREFQGGRDAWCAALLRFAEPSRSAAPIAAGGTSWIAAGVMMTTAWKVAIGFGALALGVGLGWRVSVGSRGGAASSRTAALKVAPLEELETILPHGAVGAPEAIEGERVSIAPEARSSDERAARPALLGRVVELDGTPIPNAELELATHVPEVLARATSDADGRFRFEGLDRPPKELRVFARAKQHLRGSRDPDSSGAELVIQLAPAFEVQGRVLDAESGRPIAGANLWNGDEERTASAADGSYRLGGFGIDRPARILVRREGYVAREIELRLAAEGSRALDLPLERGSPFTLRVVDARTGAALAGLDVRPNRWEPPFARTDGEGRFTVRVAAGSKTSAWIAPTDYSAANWFWSPEAIAEDELEGEHLLPMRAHARIEGRVVDESGAPVEGCAVIPAWSRGGGSPLPSTDEERRRCALPGSLYFGDPTGDGLTRTDARGEYRLRTIASEAPLVVHFSSGDHVGTRSESMLLDEPGALARVDAVLAEGGTLRGRVLCNAKPWAGIVQCEQGSDSVGSARVDADGRYEVRHVRSGSLRVRLRSTLGEPCDREAQIELRTGEVRELDFVWDEERLPIRGRVLGADREPLADVHVGASRIEPGKGVFYARAVSAADGGFELLVAPGGPYSLRAGWGATECAREGVLPGSEGVELVIPREGRLALQLVDAATREPARITELGEERVTWRPAGVGAYHAMPETLTVAAIDLDGRLEVPFPVGRYDLRLRFGWDGYQMRELRDVEVVPGDGATPRVVELERGTELELRFVSGASGAPQRPAATLLFLLAEDERDAVRGPFDEQGGASNHRVDGVNLWLADDGLLARMLRVDERGVAVVRGLAPGRYLLRSLPQALEFEPATIELGDEPRAVRGLRWSAR